MSNPYKRASDTTLSVPMIRMLERYFFIHFFVFKFTWNI